MRVGVEAAGDKLDAARSADRAGRRRAGLARHLGLGAEALGGMTDAEVDTALEHVDGLVDRINDLHARSVNDDLTGVLRRGPGREALLLELSRATRTGQPLSVAFVDVDGLKQVNDTRGHAAGDALLRSVAGTMSGRLRSTDMVMRHGGDEFVCVLPGSDLTTARQVMGEVVTLVAEASGGAGISVGLATFDPSTSPAGAEPQASHADALVAAADLDLYARRALARRGRVTPP